VNVARDTSGNIDGGFLGNLGNDILVGDGGNSIFVGGLGNDTIFAGAGNDTINWNANILNITDGHDIVDGGTNTATGDSFVVNGDNTAETYRVYARLDAIAAGITGLNIDTEIVITRNGTNNASVIAELHNIEEININTSGGADTVLAIGNFSPTSLAYSTISVNGGGGSDTVDISGLTSDHRMVFNAQSGNSNAIGGIGNDVMVGGTGADVFTGGAGSDTFMFKSSVTANLDAITDMQTSDLAGPLHDVIDLHRIDANASKAGNNGFQYIDKSALGSMTDAHFTHRGQLVLYQGEDGHYVLAGNTSGNAHAEFQIDLGTNPHHFTVGVDILT
jgi:Ca2+-binding RTX toxin-like protein